MITVCALKLRIVSEPPWSAGNVQLTVPYIFPPCFTPLLGIHNLGNIIRHGRTWFDGWLVLDHDMIRFPCLSGLCYWLTDTAYSPVGYQCDVLQKTPQFDREQCSLSNLCHSSVVSESVWCRLWEDEHDDKDIVGKIELYVNRVSFAPS